MALTQLKTAAIADDAVTTDKLANAINTERTANTAKVSLADNSVTLDKMAGGTDGQIITYDASGDPVAVGPGTDGQVLTSTGAGSPPAFETLPASNNYTHPNHSGEVTSTADGAQVIADNVVDEANLKVSNSPTNGYFLSAQSGDTGGLTWAAAGGGLDFALWRMNTGFTAPADPIVNWGANSKNVTLSESSGIITFPSTGFWYIKMQMYGYKNSDQDNIELHIMTTNNNSSYGTISHAYSHMNNDDGGNLYTSIQASHIFDVTDTSNDKVKFKTIYNQVNWVGQAGQNDSYAIFIRLGDT